METSLLRVFLQSLCDGSPWNYAVFWKLRQGHDMLLTWEDGYCDLPGMAGVIGSNAKDVYSKNLDQISSPKFKSIISYSSGFAVTEMSNSHYAFGKGIIGEVASHGMPLWVCSDHILADEYSSSLITQYPDEWLLQFAAGIKTILLIPSISDGVLQLGSLETVVEDVELVAIVKNMLAAYQELAKNPSSFVLSEETHHVPMISCHVENVMESYTSSIIGNPEVVHYVGSKEDLTSISHHRFQSKENSLNMGDAEELIDRSLFEQKNKIGAVAVSDQGTDNLLSFPKYSELQEALGPHIIGHGQLKLDSSKAFGTATNSLDCTEDFSYNRVTPASDPKEQFNERGGNGRNLLKAAGIDMAFNSRKRKHLVDSTDHIGYKKTRLALEDSIPWSSSTSASCDQDNWTNSFLSASCMTTEDHLQAKESNFVYHGKELKTPSNKKRRAGEALNQKSRPRDRQLVQDRLKELRELVPGGRKCSIDGLLDKTAKHLVFLKDVSDRSDKLREQSVVTEVLAEGTRTRNESNQNGMSWAIEVGGEKNICPIIVKDLKIPRHMLIQIVCDDFVRFLEITEVIHQLDLTVLRGVLDQQSDSRLANFIVEVPEKLHRLDIFWPLMRLVQSSVRAQNKN